MNKSRRDLCFQLTGSAMKRDNTARKSMPESVISESDVGTLYSHGGKNCSVVCKIYCSDTRLKYARDNLNILRSNKTKYRIHSQSIPSSSGCSVVFGSNRKFLISACERWRGRSMNLHRKCLHIRLNVSA